jgi:hypothetical protein
MRTGKARRRWGTAEGENNYDKYNNNAFQRAKSNCPATTQGFSEFYDKLRQECDKIGCAWPKMDTCHLLWYHRLTPFESADLYSKTILTAKEAL